MSLRRHRFSKLRLGQTQTNQSDIQLQSFKFNDDPVMVSYFGDIYVGDTDVKKAGSTDIFLFSDECKDQDCVEHKKYKKSQQYRLVKNNTSIDYISGSIQSEVGTDNVVIGDYVIKDMPLHLAFKAQLEIFRYAKWDGIVGLGFTMDNEKENFGMSIIDRLLTMDECKHKFFSFQITDKNGMLNFCKYPKNIQNYDDIFWAPIYPHGVENPWGVKILNIKIEFENQQQQSQARNMKFNKLQANNQKMSKTMSEICDFNNKSGCELLVDTGTYLTYIPLKIFDKIFKGYPLSFFENCENYKKGKLPQIIFELQAFKGSFNLILEPQDYLIQYTDMGFDQCIMGIAPDTEVSNLITIGQETLKAFTTFFDFKERKIGFHTTENNNAKKRLNNNRLFLKSQ